MVTHAVGGCVDEEEEDRMELSWSERKTDSAELRDKIGAAVARMSPPLEFIRIVRTEREGIRVRSHSLTGKQHGGQDLTEDDEQQQKQKQMRQTTRKSILKVQTARVCLSRAKSSSSRVEFIDVIAAVHIADASYFRRMQSRADESCLVLTELIAPQQSLDPHTLLLTEPLTSTPAVAHLAAQHTLAAQLDVIDVHAHKWIIADLTSEQLATAKRTARSSSSSSSSASSSSSIPRSFRVLTEIGGALGGTRHASFGFGERVLRGLLWILVPAPELGVLLLDWARSPSGARPAPVLRSIFGAVAAGDVKLVRQLVFAQLLVSEQRAGAADALVRARSDRALSVLRTCVDHVRTNVSTRVEQTEQKEHSEITSVSVAVVYGAMHAGQIVEGLLEDGFDVERVDWDTAWEMDVSDGTDGGGDDRDDENQTMRTRSSSDDDCVGAVEPKKKSGSRRGVVTNVVVATVVPAVLALEAADWAQMLRDVADAAIVAHAGADALAAVVLYLVRHAALYITLSKWALEWNRRLYEW